MGLLTIIRRIWDKAGKGQRGQVLLPILIVMTVAPLATIGFLRFTNASSESASRDRDFTSDRFASEAGINNVITDLFAGADALSPSYPLPTLTLNNEFVSIVINAPDPEIQPPGLYQYHDPGVNFGLSTLASQTHYFVQFDGIRPSRSIRVNWTFSPIRQRWQIKLYEGEGPPGAPAPTTIAEDNFETGDFIGGTGWNGPWLVQGDASIVSAGAPREGTFHAQLSSGTGQIARALDLTGQTDVRLQFWAKASSFDPGETATCSVSPDNVNFTVVRLWIDGEDDDVYRFEDIDLSGFPMGNDFWIRCNSNMSGTGDLFFIDDLKVVSQAVPTPLAEARGKKGPGELFVDVSLITGGVYTIDFFNDSGTDFVTGPFAITGDADATWIFAEAHKDYLVASTAGAATLEAYIRQIPGPTTPDTRQKVFVQSWREP